GSRRPGEDPPGHPRRDQGRLLAPRPTERRAMQGQVGASSGRGVVVAGRLVEAPAPSARERRRELVPYWLLAPTVLFLAIFFVWPMLQALVLAFQDASGALSLEPIRRMIIDPKFLEAIRNTILLTLVVVPAQVILALIMSLVLMSGIRGTGLFL